QRAEEHGSGNPWLGLRRSSRGGTQSLGNRTEQDQDPDLACRLQEDLLYRSLSRNAGPHNFPRCRRPIPWDGPPGPYARKKRSELFNLFVVGYLPCSASSIHANPNGTTSRPAE